MMTERICTCPEEQPKKLRTVALKLGLIYKDIDTLTYKYASVSTTPSPQSDEMASDSREALDGHILSRNIECRDALLRVAVSFALAPDCMTGADNELREKESLRYDLLVPEVFKDALLEPVKTLMHRYIVYGALFDWYAAGMGSGQADIYRREILEIESSLKNILRPVTKVKRPLQPFGPSIGIIKRPF